MDHVGIFWDYENCPPPSGSSGHVVAAKIRETALAFGCVTAFKAYVDVGLMSKSKPSLQSELQASGVSLIHCPHNGQKEVADRVLLVDLMLFALERRKRVTVVLITGDRDFSYAVSSLRLRGHDIVIIYPPGSSHHSLKYQASACLDWRVDVLSRKSVVKEIRRITTRPPTPAASDGSSFTTTSTGSLHSPQTRPSTPHGIGELATRRAIDLHAIDDGLVPSAMASSYSNSSSLPSPQSPGISSKGPVDNGLIARAQEHQGSIEDFTLVESSESSLCEVSHEDEGHTSIKNVVFGFLRRKRNRIAPSTTRVINLPSPTDALKKADTLAHEARSVARYHHTPEPPGLPRDDTDVRDSSSISSVSDLSRISNGEKTLLDLVADVKNDKQLFFSPFTSTESISYQADIGENVGEPIDGIVAATYSIGIEATVIPSEEDSPPSTTIELALPTMTFPSVTAPSTAEASEPIAISPPFFSPIVDKKFAVLLEVLMGDRKRSTAGLPASKLAELLVKANPFVYKQAFTRGFKRYLELAQIAQVIIRKNDATGGTVAVHPRLADLAFEDVIPRGVCPCDAKFDPLVNSLLHFRSQNLKRVPTSTLKGRVIGDRPSVLKEASIGTFKQYVTLAENAGLVRAPLPGAEWVELIQWKDFPYDADVDVGGTSVVRSGLCATAPPCTSKSASKSATGGSDERPAKAADPRFVLLTEVLKDLRAVGEKRPVWGMLGQKLIKREPGLYARAGVRRLKQYVELARSLGIVELGNMGEPGQEWIQLL